MLMDEALSGVFFKIGVSAATYPLAFILTSTIVCLVIYGIGFGLYYSEESRGDKMWVPRDAIAHDHSAYVGDTWPGKNRLDMFIGSCPSPSDEEVYESNYYD